MSSRPPLLIWDFDGTLALRAGGWSGTICETVAAEYPQMTLDPKVVRVHLQAGFPWHVHDAVRPPATPDEWWDALARLFGGVLRVACGVEEQDALRLSRNVRDVYLRPDRWQLFDDVVPALSALRIAGWKHVVLSNHVPELEQLMAALGVRPLIDAVYSSGCTGKEKPNPAAFECVFADYPEARGAWMIGDSWTTDVQGAAAVGLRSILVRSAHPDAPIRCESLHEVAGFIAAAS